MKNRNNNIKTNDVIKRRDINEFINNRGCTLSQTYLLFIDIYGDTLGQPCVGCACKPCSLLDKFKAEDSGRPYVAGVGALKTNAELAVLFNVSKRHVAKFRIPGTNELQEE